MPDDPIEAAPATKATAARRYAAFISYSRAADGKLAPAIEQGLKRFARPLFRLRALEVFRDDAALAANPGLWPSIESALDASAHLILMASPESAASPWVARELDHWLLASPAEAILVVLTDGEIVWDHGAADFDWALSTALPPVLRGRFAAEPRWIDLRWARTDEDLSLANPRLRAAIADLAAPLHGRAKDELIGEDVTQHRRLRRLTRATIGVLATLVLGLGLSLQYAQLQRAEAQAQRDEALRTQSLFLADLSNERTEAGDAVTGMLLALRALPQDGDRPYVGRAEEALRRAAAAQRELAVLDGRLADGDSAHAVAVTADGGLIAGAVERRVVLWDAHTHESVLTLSGHADHINAVRFSPDDALIATASHDGTLRLWRRGSGEPLHVLDAAGGEAWSAAFAPNGQVLAAGYSDGRVRLWDVASGELLRTLEGHSHWVRAVVFFPDGERLASAANDGSVRVWRAADGANLLTIEASKEWLLALAVSPTGKTLVSGGADNAIRFWDVEDGRLRGTLEGHTEGVAALALSRDAGRLASAAFDGTVRLWDLKTGRAQLVLRGHRGWVSSVRFVDDDQKALSASFDGTLRLWNVTPGPTMPTLAGHAGPVFAVAFSPDDRRLASGGRDATIRLWDLAGRRTELKLSGHSDSVRALAWSDDGARIASGGSDRSVRVWDARTGEGLLTLAGHADSVQVVAFSRDGKDLLSASADGVLIAWDAHSGEKMQGFEVEGRGLLAAGLGDGGRQALAVAADGRIHRWNLTTGAAGETVALGDDALDGAALSPDGSLVLTVSGLDLRLRRTDNGQALAAGRIQAPSNGLHLAPDGSRFVNASAMGTAVLFDAETLQVVLRLPWASLATQAASSRAPTLVDPLVSAAVSHDGNRVAFAPYDNTVRIWFAGRDLAQFIRHVRTRLPRCLSAEEEARFFLRTAEDTRAPADCRSARVGAKGQ